MYILSRFTVILQAESRNLCIKAKICSSFALLNAISPPVRAAAIKKGIELLSK